MHYISSDTFPTYVAKKSDHQKTVKVSGKKEFYLWGNFPSFHQIHIDEKLSETGAVSVSEIEIKEYVSLESFCYRLITFGLFTPVNYEITAKGLMPQNYEEN